MKYIFITSVIIGAPIIIWGTYNIIKLRKEYKELKSELDGINP
jgi:hypothetical protein